MNHGCRSNSGGEVLDTASLVFIGVGSAVVTVRISAGTSAAARTGHDTVDIAVR